MKKFTFIFLVLIAGAFFFVAYNFLAFDDLCKNEILSEFPNPDGKTKAVIFQRDCGSTTGFSTQVSILKSEEDLKDKAGNVFVADTNHGEAPSGGGGGPNITIEWLDQNKLKVYYHNKVRTFTKATSFSDIQITYEEIKK